MITVSRNIARVFRSFVIDSMNLDDDGEEFEQAPFGESNVIWARRDFPRPDGLFCMLRELSYVEVGTTETIRVATTDPEGLQLVHRDLAEWTVSVQVVAKLDEAAPSHLQSPGIILRRLSSRFFTGQATALRLAGCSPLRKSAFQDVSRLVRTSQWESRVAIDLTYSVMPTIVEEAGWIDTAEGTGDLDPLDESVPFSADATE
jgi:hypothetical protein